MLADLLGHYTYEFDMPLGQMMYPDGWPSDAMGFTGPLTSALTSLPGMSLALASALAWDTHSHPTSTKPSGTPDRISPTRRACLVSFSCAPSVACS